MNGTHVISPGRGRSGLVLEGAVIAPSNTLHEDCLDFLSGIDGLRGDRSRCDGLKGDGWDSSSVGYCSELASPLWQIWLSRRIIMRKAGENRSFP